MPRIHSKTRKMKYYEEVYCVERMVSLYCLGKLQRQLAQVNLQFIYNSDVSPDH